MTILLTEKEMLDVAYDYLNILPNPDNAHEIALKMDMQYISFCDLYLDVEKVSLLKIQKDGNSFGYDLWLRNYWRSLLHD